MKPLFALFTFGILSIYSAAYAQDSVQVGYFSEWPLPAQYGEASGAYANVLGTDVSWISFDNSTKMFAALESGNIQIALSQGIVPMVVVATAQHDFKVVDIAVSYPDNENCFAHPDLNFDASNTAALRDRVVALPIGTVTHFNLNKTLAHFGIDGTTMELVNMTPSQAATALLQGKADIACGWGTALVTMQDFGTALLTIDMKSAIGIRNFDVIVIRSGFGLEYPETVAKFLKITSELNTSFTASPSRMIQKIALQMNMTKNATATSMSGFVFPSMTDKLGNAWMSGAVQAHMKALADFFVTQNIFPTALENYDFVVDKSYLERAQNLPFVDE